MQLAIIAYPPALLLTKINIEIRQLLEKKIDSMIIIIRVVDLMAKCFLLDFFRNYLFLRVSKWLHVKASKETSN